MAKSKSEADQELATLRGAAAAAQHAVDELAAVVPDAVHRRRRTRPGARMNDMDQWLTDTAEYIGAIQRDLDQLRENFIDGVIMVGRQRAALREATPAPVLRLVSGGVSSA